MAKIARVVVAGQPHHIVQRGNRKQKIFLRTGDQKLYLKHCMNNACCSGWKYGPIA